MKKMLIAVIVIGVFGFIGFGMYKNISERKLQQGIASEIIRFHVLANSDSEEDQNLKIEVKNVLINYMQKKLANVSNVEEARQKMQQELPELETMAEKYMHSQGYEYHATATLEQCQFPVKEYGDLTFPPGKYEALNVRIGKSEGKNWWCVMYPSLCFVDATYQIVPEDSKEKLKTSLTEQEYQSLTSGEENVEFSCKVWEWAKNLWK